MNNSKNTVKPLKGFSVNAGSATFNTLTTKSIILDNLTIAGIFQDNILNNVQIQNSSLDSTPIGFNIPSTAQFTSLQTGSPANGYDVTFYSSILGDYTYWNPLNSSFNIFGSLNVRDCSTISDFSICKGTLSTTNTHGLTLQNSQITLSDPISHLDNSLFNSPVDFGLSFYNNNNTTNNLSFFGYQNSSNSFTFLTNASISNKIVSGTPSNLSISNIFSNSLFLNDSIYFGSTTSPNRIYSNNSSIFLNSPSNTYISSSNINLNGNVNITGSLNALTTTVNSDLYILPIGTSYYNPITSISNYDTNGNLTVNTNLPTYFQIGDTFSFKDSTINGTFSVGNLLSQNSFSFYYTTPINSTITSGTLVSTLKFDQYKDVGIQFNYWSNHSNNNVTYGSPYYKTGFFGFKHDTERFTIYHDGTNYNDVFTGNLLADLQANNSFFNSVNASTSSFTSSTIQNLYTSDLTVGTLFLNNLVRTCEQLIYTSTNSTVSPTLNTNLSYLALNAVGITCNSTFSNLGTFNGQIKTLICNTIGSNCQLNIYVDNLITIQGPNSPQNSSILMFDSPAQSVQLFWDDFTNSWIIFSASCTIL